MIDAMAIKRVRRYRVQSKNRYIAIPLALVDSFVSRFDGVRFIDGVRLALPPSPRGELQCVSCGWKPQPLLLLRP